MDLNTRLTEIYGKYWTSLQDVRSELKTNHKNISDPLLINISPNYELATVKLFVIGQQTGGWSINQEADDPIAALMNKYKRFSFGDSRHLMHTPFWQACHEINRRLNPSELTCGFVWGNLVKIDQNKRRPPKDVERCICETFPVLPMEIEITNPDVVIFFTGPYYDDRLKITFDGATFEPVKGYEIKMLARVVHKSLPYRSFRTYHPKYLRLKKQLNTIIDAVVRITGS